MHGQFERDTIQEWCKKSLKYRRKMERVGDDYPESNIRSNDILRLQKT